MVASRARKLSQLMSEGGSLDTQIDSSGTTAEFGSSSTTTVSDMAGLIALTGMSAGDQAYVTANNKLYFYNGSGWYLIATVQNDSPSAITGVNGTYELAVDGSPTTITAVSTDPEGFPLTWSYATSGLGSIATITNTNNVFTITPSTVEANAGTFTLTISATDGVNGAVNASTNLTLEFIVIVTNSKYTTILATAADFNAVPYSFSDLSYQNKSFSFSNQGQMNAVNFNANGTKMYAAAYDADAFYQYSLNPAFDISTASYDNVSLDFSSYGESYTGLWFKPDGSVMYAADNWNDAIDIYTASSGNEYVLNQYSYSSTKSLSAISGIVDLRSIVFKSDGYKFFALCNDTYAVYEFTMASAWDVENAQHSSSNIYNVNTAVGESNPRSIYVTPDGTQLLMSGSVLDKLHRFVLTTPWQVNSATYTSGDDFDFSGQAGTNIIRSILTNDDGKILYLNTSNSYTMYQYNFASTPKIVDSSSSNHPVTVNGDTHAGTFSPYRHGGYSTYFGTGGSEILVVTGTKSALGASNQDFSISAWLYPNANTDHYIYSVNDQTLNQAGWHDIYLNGSGKLTFRIQDTSSLGSLTSTSTIPVGAWTHFLINRSSNITKLYINGVEEASSNTMNNSLYVGATNAPAIGARWFYNADTPTPSIDFEGYITDLHVQTAAVSTPTAVPTERAVVTSNTWLLTCHLPYFKDSSTNSYSITASGGVSVSPKSVFDNAEYNPTVHGGSIFFDGTGDYLTVGSTDPVNFGANNFTISMWLYPTNGGAQEEILNWRAADGVSNTNFTIHRNSSNELRTYIGNGSSYFVSNANLGTLLTNVWNHVVISRSGTDLKSFINGVNITTTSMSGTVGSTAHPVHIGRDPANGAYNFTGFVADLTIDKGTATTSVTVPTSLQSSTGLDLHIKGTDASIIDKAQSSNLKQGSSSSNVIAATTITDPFGGSLPSIYISSVTHFIQTAHDIPAVGTGDFTGEAWVWRPSFTNYRTIMDNRTGSNTANRWHLAIDGSGQVYFYTNAFIITSSISLTINTWHHVAITRQNGTCRLFIDGTERGSATNTSSFNDTKFAVGSQTGISNSFSSGYIFDARFTIGLARYTSNFTPPTESLKG